MKELQRDITGLPKDYINLGAVSVHVEDLRRYVEGLDRFLENLPTALQLIALDSESPEAREIWNTANNRAALFLTVAELADFLIAFARTGQLIPFEPVAIH